MKFLIVMPGGSEWIILIFTLCLIATPAILVVFVMKNKELKKQLEELKSQNDDLLNKLNNKN